MHDFHVAGYFEADEKLTVSSRTPQGDEFLRQNYAQEGRELELPREFARNFRQRMQDAGLSALLV